MYQALNVSGKIKNRTEKNTIGTSTGPRMTEKPITVNVVS